jgi:putative ABC transport system permease protein
MKFSLEVAIQSWRKKLYKQQGLEPGFIEEIEGNLRDRIDDYIANGMGEEEAFHLAESKSINDPEAVATEYFLATVSSKRTPPWRRSFDFVFLLPNYLKIAGRNFVRKKGYTAINLIGLLLGLLICALVFLYVQYETSFDNFHSKSATLYRLAQNYRSQEYTVVAFKNYSETSSEDQLKQIDAIREISGVVDACQFHIESSPLYVQSGTNRLSIDEVLRTNTPVSFFNMFDCKFLIGSDKSFASINQGVVLTETIAEKFFGKEWKTLEGLLSRELTIGTTTYSIVGVIENIPANSHFNFTMLTADERINYWGSRTYVELEKNADPLNVAASMDGSMKEINSHLASDELFNGNILQPISSIHLNSNMLYEIKASGDIRYLYVFSIIAIIILIITITNYINLSIAMNAGRGREIGIRKVMGAASKSVAFQFLIEALGMVILVTPFMLILLSLIIPVFNHFMNVSLENKYLLEPLYLGWLCILILFIGLIAGIYPAFYLSQRKIRELFQTDSIKSSLKGLSLRKILVTCQFVLLIGVLSGTYIINQQMDFINHKDIGYKKEGLLFVTISNENYKMFHDIAATVPAVKRVGAGQSLGQNPFNQLTYRIEGSEQVFDDAYDIYLDFEALKAYDLSTTVNAQLKADAPNELFIINKMAATKLSKILKIVPEQLIGKTLFMEPEYIAEDGTQGLPFVISGFFDDINLFSLRESIAPYFIHVRKNPPWTSQAIIEFETSDISTLLSGIQNAYDQVNEETPFIYQFQEDRIAELYEQEQRIANITTLLSTIALLVAVLGIIALTVFLTAAKQKDIAIRKVLGATVFEIVKLFNLEYFKLIVIALLFALPAAYYSVSLWLSGFAFKTEINFLIFIAAALVTLFITVLSVSLISYRVATNNPVESLKDDQ